MSFIKKITQMPNEYLHKVGRRSYLEYFVKQLPAEHQGTAKKYFQDLYTLEVAADPTVYFQKLQEFNGFIQDVQRHTSKDALNGGSLFRPQGDFFGYKAAGSKIWNYFPNPFGVFAYFNEQYWAVGRCIDLVRETIESDGFALKAAEGVSSEKLKEYYRKLMSLNIEQLWVEQPIHMMMFGNFFALPHFGKKSKGLTKYEILFPPRLMPVFNRITAEIEEYEYTVGRVIRTYPKSEVDHDAGTTLFGKPLGTPPLLSCTVELETALMTMNFNNNVLQKGGLLGKIVALETPHDTDTIGSAINTQWVQEVQAQLDYIHSGTKSAQGLAAITGVKAVHNITEPGEIELNFRESRDGLDKRISNRLGIPSEKIGIPRSTTAQYQPSLVENVVNAQFDATVNSYTIKAARFFNEFLLQKHLGIYDAKLVPAGRYGAITLAAAQTLKELAATGKITTVNEGREKVLGWEPLPVTDPRGNMVLDNSLNRDAESAPAGVAVPPEDPLLEVDKIQRGKHLYIKFGGEDSGVIYDRSPSRFTQQLRKED